jgi:hypothetical protein
MRKREKMEIEEGKSKKQMKKERSKKVMDQNVHRRIDAGPANRPKEEKEKRS